MNRINSSSRNGFTLLELLASVVIMGVIGAVVFPVISASSEAYTTTREIRNRTESVAHALDRMVRVVRQAPIGASDTGIGVTTATPIALEFSDGTGFELNSGAIKMLVPGEANAMLCTNIDALSIQYLAEDGMTSTVSTPSVSHRIVVTITSGDLRMSAIGHPRVWIGQEAP